jgi:hypothetical protein
MTDNRELEQGEEMWCCFLPALQESTSLQELQNNLALENVLTHTQSSWSLTLTSPDGPLEDWSVAAASSGLKKNTTLREPTLEVSQGATTVVSQSSTSLPDYPLLRRLCVDLNELEAVLLSDNSQISKLEIQTWSYEGLSIRGLTHVLQALGGHPKLTKLIFNGVCLVRDEMRQLGMV